MVEMSLFDLIRLTILVALFAVILYDITLSVLRNLYARKELREILARNAKLRKDEETRSASLEN